MDESPDNQTDEALALLVQGNNYDAFGVLMGRYQPKLFRYGRRFFSREEHIDDAVQDIFVKAYQNIQSFDAGQKFSPWIYRIAHNTFLNLIRAETRRPLVFFDLDTLITHPSLAYDPAGEQEKAQIKVEVEKGLELLNASYREILILYYIEDLDYQAIADVLRIPLGTVGVRLRRARESLKKKLS